jgi:hypothetical protein
MVPYLTKRAPGLMVSGAKLCTQPTRTPSMVGRGSATLRAYSDRPLVLNGARDRLHVFDNRRRFVGKAKRECGQ